MFATCPITGNFGNAGLQFRLAGAFAEFERGWVKAGVSRARARGKQLGCSRVAKHTEEVVRQLLSTGKGILKVARWAGVGVSVVQRIKAEAA